MRDASATHRHRRSLTVLAAAVVLVAAVAHAEARCPRGDLDGRYCDVAGDLVADGPTDPAEFVFPDPLVLVVPALPVEVEATSPWAAQAASVQGATGVRVQVVPAVSATELADALRSGRAHLAVMPALDVPHAVRGAGFVPRAAAARADGSVGAGAVLVARSDGAVRSLPALRGRSMVAVAPDSLLGFQAQAALTWAETGFVPEVDYAVAFVATSEAALDAVLRHEADVAALPADAFVAAVGSGRTPPDAFQVVLESAPLPVLAFGHAHDLDPALADAIVSAFVSAAAASTPLRHGHAAGAATAFVRVTYLDDWRGVRALEAGLAALGLARAP